MDDTIYQGFRTPRVRESTAFPYQIKGPNQKRPGNWRETLTNLAFKDSLIQFLSEYWQDDSFADILCGKTLYSNYNGTCYEYNTHNGNIHRKEALELHCTHEEADRRIFFHVNSLADPSNVAVRTNDTDCLITGLGCKHIFHENINIWLDMGLDSDNIRKYVSVNQLAENLGERLCKALPAFHTFKGSDYTAALRSFS